MFILSASVVIYTDVHVLLQKMFLPYQKLYFLVFFFSNGIIVSCQIQLALAEVDFQFKNL